MKNLLEQLSLEDKKKKHKSKTPSKDNSNTQSLEDKKKKHKSKTPSTDNTTISPPQPQPDKVDQTTNIDLPPSKNNDFKIWMTYTGTPNVEHNRQDFVKAIEKAYLNKDKRQDVY